MSGQGAWGMEQGLKGVEGVEKVEKVENG